MHLFWIGIQSEIDTGVAHHCLLFGFHVVAWRTVKNPWKHKLCDQWIHWLIDLLVNCCFIDWFIHWVIDWLIDQLIYWFELNQSINQSINQWLHGLSAMVSYWCIDWINSANNVFCDWSINRSTDWLIKWFIC